MLPYLERQLGYAAFSLAMTALVWWGAGRIVPRGGPLAKSALSLAGACAIGFALHFFLKERGSAVASLFLVVAFLFYAGGIWIPMFLFAAALRARATRPFPRAAAFALALAALGVSFDALFVEPNRLQVREERVAVDDWVRGSGEVRIAHLSDLQTVGACERERVALEEVRRLAPDLIVLTGDYVAGPFFDTRPAEAAARSFLAALCDIAPTVAVAGHSEGGDIRGRIFAGLDLVFLEDAARDFDFGGGRRLRVVGLDPFRPDFAVARAPKSPDEALLVATHSPDAAEGLADAGVDLHLAGHTHGGQISIPFFGPPITLTKLPRRYARGLFRMDDHWMNVCAGLGMEGNHAPRIRLFCPPEICLLRLEGTRSGAGQGSD